MKIRTRIAYLFAIIVASLLLLFSLGVYYLSADYREREFYERMREKAVTTARLLYESNQTITPQTLKLIDEQDKTLLIAEQITVFDDKGNLLYKNHADTVVLDKQIRRQIMQVYDQEIKQRSGNVEILYKYYPEKERNLIVMVSATDKYGLRKLSFLITILSIGWVTSVLLIVVAGWIFAGNALAPISDLIRQVEQIDSATLDTRRVSTQNDNDEIAQLASTFNSMLDRLQKSFYIQKSFVANASHELRTPLTAVSGQIEVALLQSRTDEEYQKLLHSLHEDVNGMTKLANDLLTLAQVSSDASVLLFQEKRIDEILLQAKVDLIRKNPDYTVVVDFAEAPEEEEYYTLAVNERLLHNAFLNLMENACKFSADEAVQIKMFFKKNKIILQFMDTGIGIPTDELPYIFEPFFRSRNAATVSGHGLGLPLTQKIIELHKGTLSVSSRINAGTTFTVTLFR